MFREFQFLVPAVGVPAVDAGLSVPSLDRLEDVVVEAVLGNALVQRSSSQLLAERLVYADPVLAVRQRCG
jgi:hypothetical protein